MAAFFIGIMQNLESKSEILEIIVIKGNNIFG